MMTNKIYPLLSSFVFLHLDGIFTWPIHLFPISFNNIDYSPFTFSFLSFISLNLAFYKAFDAISWPYFFNMSYMHFGVHLLARWRSSSADPLLSFSSMSNFELIFLLLTNVHQSSLLSLAQPYCRGLLILLTMRKLNHLRPYHFYHHHSSSLVHKSLPCLHPSYDVHAIYHPALSPLPASPKEKCTIILFNYHLSMLYEVSIIFWLSQ